MAEDRENLLTHFRHSREELLAAIEGLSDEQMTDPSLDGWSIADHLAHIASWDDLRSAEVARVSAGFETIWRDADDEAEAFGEMTYSLYRGMPLAQVRWEFETSRRRLLDAIATATPRALDAAAYGEAGLRSDHESQHTAWIVRWRQEHGI